MKNLIILGLCIVVGVLSVRLYGTDWIPTFPSKSTATTTPVVVPTTPKPPAEPVVDSTSPLSSRVTIASPAKHGTVGHTFAVSGEAPGPWYFEASFPIQVRDSEGSVIGRSHGQAKGEWMTEKLVGFTASVTIDAAYHGPASLILLRDNPSGMPENDDSVTIPITVE